MHASPARFAPSLRVVEYAGWTWIVDLKSTAYDAGLRGVGRAVESYGYYLQSAFYLDGLAALAPRERRFAFVVVEKAPPYAIAVYEPDTVLDELGREEYRRHLLTWKQCMRSGVWPGYPDEIQTLEASPWLERRLTREAA